MKHKYIWINYEKGQYLNSADFDEPVNIKGYYRNSSKVNNALMVLLAAEWKLSKIALISDSWDEDKEQAIISDLRNRCDNVLYLNNLWLSAIDEYENMRYKFDKEFIVEDICFYTYVINHTKKEYYRRKSNRDRNNWFSPISFLMISGNGYYGGKYGYWLNDDVEASNNIDNLIKEGYTNKTPLYTYSYFIGCSEK